MRQRFLQIHKMGDVPIASVHSTTLKGFTGRQELSRIYMFRLYMEFPVASQIAFTRANLMGKQIIFSSGDGTDTDNTGRKYFSGIVRRFAFGDNDGQRQECWAEVVPELWKLTEMSDNRRYASMSVPDLVTSIVGEKLDNTIMRLDASKTTETGKHPARTAVQHDETYLDLLARHMDDENIFYYFQEPSQLNGYQQAFVLGNTSDDYVDEGANILALTLNQTSGSTSMLNVTNWQRQFNYQPAKWSVHDYDFHVARDFNMTAHEAPQETKFRKLKPFAGFDNSTYATTVLHRMTDREDARSEFVSAQSDCPKLFPGRKIIVSDPAGTEIGKFVVTAVEHRAYENATLASNPSTVETAYMNRFTCVPVTIDQEGHKVSPVVVEAPESTISPAGVVEDLSAFEWDVITRGTLQTTNAYDTSVRAKPRPRGPAVAEVATVVDVDGWDEVHDETDPRGKTVVKPANTGDGTPDTTGYGEVMVQVRFSWEKKPDGTGNGISAWTSGRWMRVLQPVAGGSWGMKFVPRVGDEVVVLYLNGDESRPIVVGSLYNNDRQVSQTANQMEFVEVEAMPHLPYLGSESRNFKNPKAGKPDLTKDGADLHKLARTDRTLSQQVASVKDPDVSGIVTRSRSPDAKASLTRANELLFRDTWDQEEIYVHAAKDLNMKIERDMNIEICGNKTEIIRGNSWTVVNVGPASPVVNSSDLEKAANKPFDDQGRPLLRGLMSSDIPYAPGDTGVTRGVVDGVSFDVDKVIGFKVVENEKKDDGNTIWKVKEETWANTESRTVGDSVEVRNGVTEQYFYGNSFSFSTGARESVNFGGFDFGGNFAGVVVGLTGAIGNFVFDASGIAFAGNYTKLKGEYNRGIKYEWSDALDIKNAPISLTENEVRSTRAILSTVQADVHEVDAQVINYNGATITLNANGQLTLRAPSITLEATGAINLNAATVKSGNKWVVLGPPPKPPKPPMPRRAPPKPPKPQGQ